VPFSNFFLGTEKFAELARLAAAEPASVFARLQPDWTNLPCDEASLFQQLLLQIHWTAPAALRSDHHGCHQPPLTDSKNYGNRNAILTITLNALNRIPNIVARIAEFLIQWKWLRFFALFDYNISLMLRVWLWLKDVGYLTSTIKLSLSLPSKTTGLPKYMIRSLMRSLYDNPNRFFRSIHYRIRQFFQISIHIFSTIMSRL